jgi:predicted alpha-1,6-mannanase (GH76 family)
MFALVVSGWDNDTTHPCPGGVLFSQDPGNVDRNTVTNAPGVELGLRLYQITHQQVYLDWSHRFYDWVRGCLLAQSGLFEDHITFDGTIDRTIWTYNQGTMIGADVLFWEVTGQASYLRRAKRAASLALSYFTPGRLRNQPVFFNAIFFDNLNLLNNVRPNSSYVNAMQQYANWAWSRRRNKQTGVFSFGTDGGAVLEQSAAVRIYAILAGAAAIG